jgi:hypothetical protein
MRMYTRRKKRQARKNKLHRGGQVNQTAAVCAIMIREEPYMDEWIIYYIYGLGFAHIYIYDNSDDNVIKGYSDKYPGKVTIRHMPGKVKQLNAYNDFLTQNNNAQADKKHTWCAFFDCDEFLVLKEQTNIIDFLIKYCKSGGVAINWHIYGDNNLTTYENKPVTERFIKRGVNVDQHIKTIAKCEDLDSITDLHGMGKWKPGRSNHDTNGKKIDGPFNSGGPADKAVLNHYATKTKEEYAIKKNRGRADVDNTKNVSFKRTNAMFNALNKNEVDDDSAFKIYQRAKEIYDKRI